jgi:hypothetical protein
MRELKARQTKEHMAKIHKGRREGDLDSDGDSCPGPQELEEDCRRPAPLGAQGFLTVLELRS